MGHNSETPSTKEREIKDSIALFTKAGKLCIFAYAKVTGNRIADSEESELADEREEYDVIGKEDQIEPAFAVSWVSDVVCWRGCWIRDKEKGCKGAGRGLCKYERGEEDPINMQKDRD